MSVPHEYIPKYLDEPARFLVWTYPQALCLGAPVFWGIMTKSMMLGLLGSLLIAYALRRFKSVIPGGCFMSFIYWHLPYSKRSYRFMPPSHIREYLS